MSSIEWSMLIALSILWGGSFFFNEIALGEIPVITLAFLRVAIAAVVLTMFLHMWGERLPASGSIWSAFIAMGLLNNVLPFTLILAGQQHIASGVASILNAATPLFTVVLAHFLTRDERMTSHKVLGVIIGFSGVAAMIGADAVRDLGKDVVAQTLCLAGALSYAFAGIFGRRFRSLEITPIATATGQVIASSILLMPLMLVTDRPWNLPMPGGGGNRIGHWCCDIVDRLRLHSLLPYPGNSWCDQPASGHFAHPCQCHSARCPHSRRSTASASRRRNDLDSGRARRN